MNLELLLDRLILVGETIIITGAIALFALSIGAIVVMIGGA